MTKFKCVSIVLAGALLAASAHAGLVREPLPEGWYWSKNGVPVQKVTLDIPADASPRVKWLLQRIEDDKVPETRPPGRGAVTLADNVQVEEDSQGGNEDEQQNDEESPGIEKAQHCESDYREKVGRNGKRQIVKTHSCKSREGGPQDLYPEGREPHEDLE